MSKQALADVKIADFSWYAAGPVAVKYLGEHGAQVIHIESNTRLDGFRTSAPYKDDKPGINRAVFFACYNDSKYGVSLNLRHPRKQEVVKRIINWADVVIENYTPGTMERLGTGYKQLRQIKPDIIMVSTCNQGQTGPYASHPGFGSQLTSLCGVTHLTGWPDRCPIQIYAAYTDYIAVRHVMIAALAALEYRRRTGKGQHVDVSQYESSIQFIMPPILDFIVNGIVAHRTGNRCPYAAPYNAYPCLGDERWCTIAIFTDVEWKSFCQVLGNPAWTQDPRFASLTDRKQSEEELDALVSEWTCRHTAEEVMVALQKAGIDSGIVKNAQEMMSDPQLGYRRAFRDLNHPEIGLYTCLLPGMLLSKTPAQSQRPSPCLGEHNEYVYTQMLGMPDDEFAELLAEGVFE